MTAHVTAYRFLHPSRLLPSDFVKRQTRELKRNHAKYLPRKYNAERIYFIGCNRTFVDSIESRIIRVILDSIRILLLFHILRDMQGWLKLNRLYGPWPHYFSVNLRKFSIQSSCTVSVVWSISWIPLHNTILKTSHASHAHLKQQQGAKKFETCPTSAMDDCSNSSRRY